MPGSAVRCPSCGHALFTVDEPAWPARTAGPASPAPPAGPLLLSVTRAAELLGASRSTLYQLVAAGRVPVVRLGRAVRVSRRGLERLAGGAPLAVLTTPGAEHAGAEPLPGSRAVQGVVPAAVGLPSVLGAAATRAAGRDAADRAEFHGASRMRAGPCLTLVTLACTPFDIATSVVE